MPTKPHVALSAIVPATFSLPADGAERPTYTVDETIKVPAATLGFWIIKIAATTLGETGGDAVTMSLHLGYLVGTAIFAAVFLAAVAAQIAARASARSCSGS